MAIIHADQQIFEEMVANKETFFVDFFATWCGPCKMLGHVLESVNDKLPEGAKIVKIDIDKERQLAELFNVNAVPTMMFFVNGKSNGDVLTGFIPETDLLPKLQEFFAKAE